MNVDDMTTPSATAVGSSRTPYGWGAAGGVGVDPRGFAPAGPGQRLLGHRVVDRAAGQHRARGIAGDQALRSGELTGTGGVRALLAPKTTFRGTALPAPEQVLTT